ncbi:hypothetical protein MJO29_003554 [Puccinia striiformis f. sp. tritici]|nr:hypothetical protein MJO29_003554 [Puccinia striiformis f. sp. tritici]
MEAAKDKVSLLSPTIYHPTGHKMLKIPKGLAEFYNKQDVSGGNIEASNLFGTNAAELLKNRCLTSITTQPTQSETFTQPASLRTTTDPSAPGRPLLSKKAQAQRAWEIKKMAKEKKDQLAQAWRDQLAGFTKASKEKFNL